MDQVARRRRRRRNSTQNLTVLIGLLVFVLIAVVIVAVFVHNSEKNPDNTEPPQTGPGAELTITAPAETEFVTLEKTLLFQGGSDPAQSLTVNGTQVPREADGSFSYPFTLEPGINEITLSHKGRTVIYRVEYRYTVQSYAPSGDVSYSSGATVRVEVFAREGSTLHVTLAGREISMEKAEDQAVNGMAEGFARYTGTYQLPEGNTEDLILGAIEYSVTCDGITETYRSGTVMCRKWRRFSPPIPASHRTTATISMWARAISWRSLPIPPRPSTVPPTTTIPIPPAIICRREPWTTAPRTWSLATSWNTYGCAAAGGSM